MGPGVLDSRPLSRSGKLLGMEDGAWVPCPGGCDDYWCKDHGEHAGDCACPPIEKWVEAGKWPYSTEPPPT